MPKVAILSTSFASNPTLLNLVRERYEITAVNNNLHATHENLIALGEAADIWIVGREPITANIMAASSQLKIISKHGVGLENIDLIAMRDRQIALAWCAGVNARSVAELTLSMMLTACHQMATSYRLLLEKKWQKCCGEDLRDRTIGIIGCGAVGKAVVELLAIFNCKILVNDIRDYPAFYAEYAIQPVALNTLLQTADIVSVHVPLNNHTYHLLSLAQLSLMQKGSILINTARGNIVDEAALKILLQQDHFATVALDVFSNEPNIDFELLKFKNVFATSHIAGSTRQAQEAMGMAAIENIATAAQISTEFLDEYNFNGRDFSAR